MVRISGILSMAEKVRINKPAALEGQPISLARLERSAIKKPSVLKPKRF